ncbi:hypothetical protein FRC01_000333 [Tulasnella sp. 417]|nr:hypothetical protein FRC01_000333 [Tulasnella sp. 417]
MIYPSHYPLLAADNAVTIEYSLCVTITWAISQLTLSLAAFNATSSRGGRLRSSPSELLRGINISHTPASIVLVRQLVYNGGIWHMESGTVIKGTLISFLAGIFCAAFIRGMYMSVVGA